MGERHAQSSYDEPLMISIGPSGETVIRNEEMGRLSYQLPQRCFATELPALLRACDAEWIFLYLSDEPEDFCLRNDVKQALADDSFDAALFDEVWPDGTMLRYADDDAMIPYSLTGNGPSNLLIRRQKLLSVWEQRVDPISTLPELVLEVVAQGIALRKLGRGSLYAHGSYLPVTHARQDAREQKRILVVSHELSRTGAPLVLAEACLNVLRPQGYQMMVLSPSDGPVADMYMKGGISVMIQPDLLRMDSDAISRIALGFDLVFICTIVPYACVWLLNGLSNVQVMWWVHDCKLGYQSIGQLMPARISDNIHVFCGGEYELNVLKEFCPAYDASVLLYGVKDRNPDVKLYRQGKPPLQFASIASVENRKGQDILAQAIELLDRQTRAKCHFLFIGSVLEQSIFDHVQEVMDRYPDNVTYRKNIPRDELDQIYQSSDCIVCCSRDDPMPAFVAESMMFGRPVICSEHTGFIGLIQDGENGFLYRNDDPKELAKCITAFTKLSEKQRVKISREARKCYETHFSIPRCEQALLAAVEDSLQGKSAREESVKGRKAAV